MRQRIVLSVQSVMLLGSSLCGLYGQQLNGTIVGSVVDPSGSLIPNAQITVTNKETNAARETRSDGAGNYIISFLPAGSYKITASVSGFREKTVDNETLQVGQTLRVDFAMEVGNVTEKVEVQASPAALQTENAAVGGVIDGDKIVDLPLNGRNFIQLAQLIPGGQPGCQVRLPSGAGEAPSASRTALSDPPAFRPTGYGTRPTGITSMGSSRWMAMHLPMHSRPRWIHWRSSRWRPAPMAQTSGRRPAGKSA